jgi:hypothetical protein
LQESVHVLLLQFREYAPFAGSAGLGEASATQAAAEAAWRLAQDLPSVELQKVPHFRVLVSQ